MKIESTEITEPPVGWLGLVAVWLVLLLIGLLAINPIEPGDDDL